MRVRVRSSKNEVRCASACGTIIKVRVCVRHTVKILATQHLAAISAPTGSNKLLTFSLPVQLEITALHMLTFFLIAVKI